MRYPNAPDREALLESLDLNAQAYKLLVQRFLDGEAPTRCDLCNGPLEARIGMLACDECGRGWDAQRKDWTWEKRDGTLWISPRTRIWADFNTLDDEKVSLNTYGSVKSLEENPVYIGEKVIITDDDIEVEALIEEVDGKLWARPDWSTQRDCIPCCSVCGVQDVSIRPDADALEYYCEKCGYELAGHNKPSHK